ncbi:MAG: putative zinc protease [Chroococcopsis gigantea SAG 12.99]|nr:putative zinc protease [Chroococcopsis gigantea SAG 12.99]
MIQNLVKLTQPKVTNQFPAKILQLDNGLTVIHQYIPVTPVVVVDVWVDGGAILEPDDWCGMAHFLEHMVFKGTKKVAPGEFDWVIENCGGMTNAATSHDYAHFYLTTDRDNLKTTLPYLAEILLYAEIADEDFYCEKEVVMEEMRSCYDDPDWMGYQTLVESLYSRHPYGRPILGDEERILRMTPNQMRCFHQTYYQPQNMTVVIVGGVEENEAMDIVYENFSEFPAPSECPSSNIEAEPPLIDIRRSHLYLPRLEQSRLQMGWTGPGVDRIEDAIGLDLISVLLGGGRCSRLVQQLREEHQLVLDVDSAFSLQRDSSLFTINTWLLAPHIQEVENLLCEQLTRLRNQAPGLEELQRAQKILCHDYYFSTETPGQLAGLYGYYQILEQPRMSVLYPEIIKKFTPEDIQRLAHQYLSTQCYAVTIMQPSD